MFNNKEKGFTLIELLVAVSIVGLVSSTVLSLLQNTKIKTMDARRIQIVQEYIKAVELAYLENGGYPSKNFVFTGFTACLGGNLYSDERCGSNDSFVQIPEIDAAIIPYLSPLPIIEGGVYYNQNNQYEGFVYSCPTSNPCVTPKIEYMPEQDGAQCGPGIGFQIGTKTFCTYTFN